MQGELAGYETQLQQLDGEIAAKQADRALIQAQRDELADLIAHTQTFVPDAAAV
jgi:hypothetical protein